MEVSDKDLFHNRGCSGLREPNLSRRDEQFCAARVLPVRVGGLSPAIVRPAAEVMVHTRNIVELVAPCHLKQAIGLDDGAELVIPYRCPPE